jgi:hypothetical protein
MRSLDRWAGRCATSCVGEELFDSLADARRKLERFAI